VRHILAFALWTYPEEPTQRKVVTRKHGVVLSYPRFCNVSNVKNISQTNTVLKRFFFWDVTPCSPLKANWRFGGKCRRINQAGNQHESCSKQRRGTRHFLKAWNLLWFCHCFITSRQWLPFRCLELTVVLDVTVTHTHRRPLVFYVSFKLSFRAGHVACNRHSLCDCILVFGCHRKAVPWEDKTINL
jgi:hypothetical protein